MVKEHLKQARFGEKDLVIMAALKKKNIGDNDSDRIRMGLRALARENGVKVPA